jgi:hypothetical protein
MATHETKSGNIVSLMPKDSFLDELEAEIDAMPHADLAAKLDALIDAAPDLTDYEWITLYDKTGLFVGSFNVKFASEAERQRFVELTAMYGGDNGLH